MSAEPSFSNNKTSKDASVNDASMAERASPAVEKADTPPNGEDEPGESSRIARLLDRFRQILPFRKNASLRQDLEVVLEQGDSDLTFSPEERAMLRNILRLREVRADHVMVPRADIDAVDVSTSLGEVLFLFEESRHSRLPVYRETLDDPIGIVHVKDVMGSVMAQAEESPNGKLNEEGQLRNNVVDYDFGNLDLTQPLSDLEILRPLLFVPPSMPASDIFAKMQATRTQMAVVIDEYGGTDGLISMEDVVETVVGNIEDEHDEEPDALVVADGPNRWNADARVSIEQLCEALGTDMKILDTEDDVDTLGGFLFTQLGRIPVRGEVVRAFEGFDFEILDADPRRIRQVRIVPARSPVKRRFVRDKQSPTQSAASEVTEATAPDDSKENGGATTKGET